MQKKRWVIVRWRKRPRRRIVSKKSQEHYALHKESARALVHTRVAYFNHLYNVPIRKIFIKNHKSRWGSCSEKGNLNFNYKIVFLAPELADYIIVHELCHLVVFNHSPDFWSLVAQTAPDYKVLRQTLRTIR